MTKDVGLLLCISPCTVSRHIRNLCRKYAARNTVHLLSLALGCDACSRHPELTRRENEIISMLVHGMTPQMIADAMGISPKTVYKHRENIFMKLCVQSIRMAAAVLRHRVPADSKCSAD